MAIKKAASKKVAEGIAAPEKAAAHSAAPAKAAAKTSPAKKVEASPAAEQPRTQAAVKAAKARPSHHDVSVQAYLLWERDGKKHGHHDHYWQLAERELAG